MEVFLDPFQFAFFRNGLLVATLSGALCGMIGTYVVLRGMSYIGHGLSHAIFGGFAVSTLSGIPYLLGAGVWGLASALAISQVSRRRIIGADAAIGVITTSSFALGLTLFALFGQRGRGFEAALFGSILGVGRSDVLAVVCVGLFAAAVVLTRYRRLLFSTFDPDVADVSGVPVARTDALLMLVLSLSILVTMRVLGVTLIAATLVIPAVVARMVTDQFHRMLLLATGIGAATGAIGMIASYHANVQSGPAIVLVGGTLFAVVYTVTGQTGRRRVQAAHVG